MADQTNPVAAAAPKAVYRPYSQAIVLAKPFENRKTGKMSVQLYAVAGKVPNANVISVEVAKNAGFTLGNKYEVDILEGPNDPQYGRQFRFNSLGEFTGTAKKAVEDYGPAELVTVRVSGSTPAPTGGTFTEVGDNDLLTLQDGTVINKLTGAIVTPAPDKNAAGQPETEKEPETEGAGAATGKK